MEGTANALDMGLAAERQAASAATQRTFGDAVDIVLAAIITVVSLATLLQHGWAYKGHFTSDAMPRGAVLLTIIVVAAAFTNLWALWTGPLWVPAMVIGLALQLASVALFWLAIAASRTARLRLAFDPSLPRSVVKDGVYRFMRHPFYTSYVLFWIGWAIAAWSIWALAALIVVVAIYVWAARMEERNFARSELAEEYDTYRRQTGVFGRKSLLK